MHFPAELPITAHREQLADLIKSNPVVVICGETGSGKSTQIPKICMAAGYGRGGMICQTQPRRIAARSVAERIAQELKSPLGEVVGYRVRFSEQVSERNLVRVLTDGMLLAELERDPLLKHYQVLIVDEAHERSLNIDFLLGLAQRILRERKDFRLIITSATLDSEKFSKQFDNAPTASVSGRTYPVEFRYRPIEKDSVEALPESIRLAIEELQSEGPGDILVFLPGEREIREVADWLAKRLKKGIEILPLFARLSPVEQKKIFSAGSAIRIVLATNVAETSITVPGIRYVIDSGLARVSRYSPTRKLQRLPLEKISKAAANQRAGRCGRTAPGICIRLYEDEDYQARPQYTDPEILRTSLADVILRMKVLGVGDIDSFPFLDRPGRRQINDGLQHLVELGAVNENKRITKLGRRIASMPVDPRVARMLLAAEKFNCLQEVVVIASALSVPDPRQVPADKLQHARQVHKELSDAKSDFLVFLDIWNQFRSVQKTQSKRKSYRWCEEHFLSVFRMREWAALQGNIKLILKRSKVKMSSNSGDHDRIHQALLSGLLSNVAQREVAAAKQTAPVSGKAKRMALQYHGTFGKSLQIFPGSVLIGKSPKWIMSAELVETGKVFARTVSGLQPQWLEPAAKHLLQFHYSDPHWDPHQERVVARRRATLYGLTIYSGRKCDYSQVNAEDCRVVFIRSALVDGGLKSRLKFYDYNRELVKEIESLEHKTRRRDILVDDNEVFEFYNNCLPESVNSGSSLRKWYRKLPETEKDKLLIPRERLMLGDQEVTENQFPDSLDHKGIRLNLRYLFDPSNERDGVTAQVKLPLLNQMSGALLDKLVPGLLEQKIIALMRTLPKEKRRHLVPIPETAAGVYSQVSQSTAPLVNSLAQALQKSNHLEIHPSEFDTTVIPKHLGLGIELVDDENKFIAYGKDLAALKEQYGLRAHNSFVDLGAADILRSGIRKWDFESIPETIDVAIDGYQTIAYPALVDCEDSVSIEIFDQPVEAEYAHQEGVRRLLWLTLPEHRKLAKKPIPNWQKISLMYAAIGDLSALQLAMFYQAQDRVFFVGQPIIRNKHQFDSLISKQAHKLAAALAEIATHIATILERYRDLMGFLNDRTNNVAAATKQDVESHIDWLVYDGFVEDTPVVWLPHIPRYLEALIVRMEQARLDPAEDARRMEKIASFWNQYLTCEYEYSEHLERWRWMLEEYRVSVFAQSLGTSMRVSEKRLIQAWNQIIEHNERNP